MSQMHDFGNFLCDLWWFGDVLEWFYNAESRCVRTRLNWIYPNHNRVLGTFVSVICYLILARIVSHFSHLQTNVSSPYPSDRIHVLQSPDFRCPAIWLVPSPSVEMMTLPWTWRTSTSRCSRRWYTRWLYEVGGPQRAVDRQGRQDKVCPFHLDT